MRVGLILISLLVCLALLTGPYIRWGIAVLIILVIFGNTQLRTRVCILAGDIKEIIACLFNNKEVSFDKLVEDLFKELDDEEKEEGSSN